MERFFQEFQCGGFEGGWDSRFTLKGSKPFYSPDRTFDTEHILLDLQINMKQERVRGRCVTSIRAITDTPHQMVFNAETFKVSRVLWDGQPASYQHKNGKLTVKKSGRALSGAQSKIEIEYQINKPTLGMYFIKPDRQYPRRPVQMWTQGQDEFARYWFPCHDSPQDRTTTEMMATVPQGFMAVSNGALKKTTHNRKTKTSTYHWIQEIPHATYLVTLAVGRFAVIKDKWGRVPVQYYCEKGREADVKRTFGKTPKMIDFFSKSIGVAYPYPKYAQVVAHDFIYGGMENTSATTQTEYAVLDKRAALDYSSDELVAHELAHQWFGDYLTCKDWSHAWLNESFATYFDALFKRHDKGEDEFLYAIKRNADEYFEEDRGHYRRPIVTHIYKRPTDLFDRHLYEKGSVVLYMLHRWLGEGLFWKSINHYVRKNKERAVETHDLMGAIEEVTGKNVRRFFDQWVFGAGHPEFKINWWWEPSKKLVHIRLVQAHKTDGDTRHFWGETEFLFMTRKGEKTFPVVLGNKAQSFKFKLDSEPRMILFDPDQKLLKKVQMVRPSAMLLVQLKKARNPIARIEAAQDLAQMGHSQALMALGEALLTDSFWGAQAEFAAALGKTKDLKAADILLKSLDKIKNDKVRRSIFGALKNFKSPHISQEIARRFKKEKSYFSKMEGLSGLGVTGHPKAAVFLKAALKQKSWNEVIKTAALEGLAATQSPEWIPTLLSHTKPGHHQRLRIAAIRCLAQLSKGMPEIQNRFIELSRDPFLLVQIAAVRALHQNGDERAVPALKKLMVGHRDGRLKRLAEEAVNNIMKGID